MIDPDLKRIAYSQGRRAHAQRRPQSSCGFTVPALIAAWHQGWLDHRAERVAAAHKEITNGPANPDR